MFGEAAWMLRGKNDVATVSKYAGAITRFSDNGITFFGAYGPKIIDQLPYVKLNIQAGSRHLYETDFKKVDQILTSDDIFDFPYFSFNDLIPLYHGISDRFIPNLERAANSGYKVKYKVLKDCNGI
jgi:hypothetical protein